MVNYQKISVISSNSIASDLLTCLYEQKKSHLGHPYPSLIERKADINQLAHYIKTHEQGLIQAISADYGYRSAHETIFAEFLQVQSAAKHAIKHLKSWLRPQNRHVDRLTYGLASNRVLPQPLGVVGVIVPWNFPINLSFVPLVYIFAAGNRAMVKMSENSRHLAAFLIKTIPDFFSPEKLQFFDETGGVGIAFSTLRFDYLLFTGSGATGKAVMASAAKNLTPVTLELGGKSPAIIADDFPVNIAAERIWFAKTLNAGQICTSVDHVFVPKDKISEFVVASKAIIAKRFTDLNSPDYTSIINVSSYQRLKNALEDARSHQCEIVPLMPDAQFDDDKHRLAPQLVINPPSESLLMQREIFGPILPVIAYNDINAVIQSINENDVPLAIYPFSNQDSWINNLISRVMSGGVSVNDALLHVGQDDLPFGGMGESGMGHYHGREGFNTFSKLRPIFNQSRFATSKLLYPPYGKIADWLLAFLRREV